MAKILQVLERVYGDKNQIIVRCKARFADGKEVDDFIICTYGDAVSVLSVAITDSGEAFAILQDSEKTAANRRFLTCQAGKISKKTAEDGLEFIYLETPEEAARREVKEECGLSVGKLISLGWVWSMPEKVTDTETFFLNLIKIKNFEDLSPFAADCEEGTKPVIMPWQELKQMFLEDADNFVLFTREVIRIAQPCVDDALEAMRR